MGFFKTTNAPERFPAKIFLPDNLIETRRTVRKTSQIGYVHPAATVPNFSIELGEWFSWALNNNIIVWDTTPYVDINIYTGDGSLISERTLTHDGFDMLFDTADDSKFTVGGNDTFLEVDGQNQYIRIGDISNGIGDSNGIFIDNTNGIVAFGDAADDGTITVGIQSEVSTGYVTDYGIRRFADYGLGVNTDVFLSKINSGYAAVFATDGTIIEVDISTLVNNPDQNIWLQFVADVGSVSANTTTDIFTFIGGTGITTTIVGDTITIDNTDPNELHTGEVESTSPTNLIAHESIISNKTEVTPVTGDYLLLWDATDNLLKKINYSQVLGVSPNLWATFTGDAGTTTANTTTDTFNIVGGAGIDTAIVGDTITITNTGVGATYTASNGLILSVADFQLGGTVAAGGTWDFTASRFLYTDTFNLTFESANGFFSVMDGATGFTMIGTASTPDATLHVVRQGQTGGGLTLLGTEVAVFQADEGTDAAISVISDDDESSYIYLGTPANVDASYIRYRDNADSMYLNVGGIDVVVLENDGSVQFPEYGAGTFSGIETYLLGTDVNGNVIEVDITAVGDDTTIYDRDGTLTGNRVLTGNTFSMVWGFNDVHTSQFYWSDTDASRYIFDGVTSYYLEELFSNSFATTLNSGAGNDPTIKFSGDNTGIILSSISSLPRQQRLIFDYTNTLVYLSEGTGTGNFARLDLEYGVQARLYLDTTNYTLSTGIYDIGGGDSEIRLYSAAIDDASALNGYVWTLTDDTTGAGEWTSVGGSIQNLWLTIVGDTGTTVANTPTDALTIIGGTDIETIISGDTITINYTGPGGGSDTNIYNTSGSLTANRTLTGLTFDLLFNFTNGANVSTQTWTDTSQNATVSNATNSNVLLVGPSTFSRTVTSIAGSDSTYISLTPTTISIGKDDPGVYVQSLGAVGATWIISSQSYVNSQIASVTLDAGTAVTLQATSTGHDTSLSIVNVGADSELRFNSTGLAAASNGYVWTLIDDANGHGEWQAAPGNPNLWLTFIADTGTTSANTPTDTLTITGGTDIETVISGDTLTINWTGSAGADTNIYNTSGSLTANRTLTMLNFDLIFDGLASNNIYTKWDAANNRWYSYAIQGGQYLAVKTPGSLGTAAEIGAWTSSLDSTTNNILSASSTGVGLYRNVAGTTTDYVKVIDAGALGSVELHSDDAGYTSTLTLDGPITTIEAIGTGFTSYARAIFTGSASPNANTIDLTVYDGGTDTNSLIMNDVETTSTSAWADTGVKTDATARNADHHNYNPTDLDKTRIIRYNSTGFHYLTGMSNAHAQDGTVIELWNIGTQAFNIRHESASSSANNRFLCPSASDYRIASNAAAIIRYDATSGRWRIIAGTA